MSTAMDETGSRQGEVPGEAEPITPRMAALLFCDYASRTDQGKFNLLGIFERVFIPEQPPVPPMFFAYVRATGSGMQHVELIGYDPDGSEGMKLTFNLRGEPAATDTPTLEFVLPFAILPDKLGTHWFELRCQGERLGRVPLFVERLKQEPDGNRTAANSE